MGTPAVGDVVVIPFPFSDVSASKKRPALVAGLAEFGDVILCQITSRPFSSEIAIPLNDPDFATGGLQRESYVRPDKLFTADRRIVIRQLGRLSPSAINLVRSRIGERFA